VGDLWHRGVRNLGDIVLDDSFFDREEFGAGWDRNPATRPGRPASARSR